MSRIIAVLLLYAGVSAAGAADGTHLVCTGQSGLSPKQDLIPLVSRTITDNRSAETGSLFVDKDKLVVEGVQWMEGEFKICEDTNQKVVFSPSCLKRNPDFAHDYGILNKVTGDLRYHAGDALFLLNCRQAKKVLK